jgi:hypothetical protein
MSSVDDMASLWFKYNIETLKYFRLVGMRFVDICTEQCDMGTGLWETHFCFTGSWISRH